MQTAIKLLLVFLAIYPAALFVAVATDSVLGDLVFIDRLLYDSKRQLLEVIISDWLDAAIWIAVLMLFSTGVYAFLPKFLRILVFLSAIVIVVLGYMTDLMPQMLGLVIALSLAVPFFVHWRAE